jgi:hypothetical protein
MARSRLRGIDSTLATTVVQAEQFPAHLQRGIGRPQGPIGD